MDNLSGLDIETKETYLKIRENTRKQCLIYSKHVLPLTIDVFKKISSLMDNFADIEPEKWILSLSDTRKKLKDAKSSCENLKNIHNEIIRNLKANHAEAESATDEFKKIEENCQESIKVLHDEAKKAQRSEQNANFWGKVLSVPTFGIGYVIAGSVAENHKKQSQTKDEEAVKLKKDMEAVKRAVSMSHELEFILDHLLERLQSIFEFIGMCELNVEKMVDRTKEAKSSNDDRDVHYKTTKKRAQEIRGLCDTFVTSTAPSLLNNLALIPSQPEDETFLQEWKESHNITLAAAQLQLSDPDTNSTKSNEINKGKNRRKEGQNN